MKTPDDTPPQGTRLGTAIDDLWTRCRSLVEARPGIESVDLPPSLASRQSWHLTGPSRLQTTAWWSALLGKLVAARFSSVWHGPRLMMLAMPREELSLPIFYTLVRGEGGRAAVSVEVVAPGPEGEGLDERISSALQELRESYRRLPETPVENVPAHCEGLWVQAGKADLELATSAVLAYLDRYLDLLGEVAAATPRPPGKGELPERWLDKMLEAPFGAGFDGGELLGGEWWSDWRAFLRNP